MRLKPGLAEAIGSSYTSHIVNAIRPNNALQNVLVTKRRSNVKRRCSAMQYNEKNWMCED